VLEGEEMNDPPLDIESTKTHNATKCVGIPVRDIHSEDTGSKIIPRKDRTRKKTPVMGKHKWRKHI
jgi:hypothetical protein